MVLAELGKERPNTKVDFRDKDCIELAEKGCYIGDGYVYKAETTDVIGKYEYAEIHIRNKGISIIVGNDFRSDPKSYMYWCESLGVFTAQDMTDVEIIGFSEQYVKNYTVACSAMLTKTAKTVAGRTHKAIRTIDGKFTIKVLSEKSNAVMLSIEGDKIRFAGVIYLYEINLVSNSSVAILTLVFQSLIDTLWHELCDLVGSDAESLLVRFKEAYSDYWIEHVIDIK